MQSHDRLRKPNTSFSLVKTYLFLLLDIGVIPLFHTSPESLELPRTDKYLDSCLNRTQASGDSFEIGDGRILIYSSIGVQNSIF